MDWQDIATAPKDGLFLVYGGMWEGEWSGPCDHGEAISLVLRDRGGPFYVADTEYYGPQITGPTHWQPLPEPPTPTPEP